jgi:ABC-type uncharacterized transport system permease subunit
LFGTLSHGGLAVSERVPKELVDVLQAIIIVAVAATSAYMRYRWRQTSRVDGSDADKGAKAAVHPAVDPAPTVRPETALGHEEGKE